MGGKNNIRITRTGHRFPNKKWAVWRDEAVRGVREQLSRHFKTITEPVNVRVTYVAGDRRRRDCPAILDAVWHVLEKAGVVADDTLLWPVESIRSYDKDSPRCEIEVLNL
jgi:Holliday junction resolvase RusA-like endonuclease